MACLWRWKKLVWGRRRLYNSIRNEIRNCCLLFSLQCKFMSPIWNLSCIASTSSEGDADMRKDVPIQAWNLGFTLLSDPQLQLHILLHLNVQIWPYHLKLGSASVRYSLWRTKLFSNKSSTRIFFCTQSKLSFRFTVSEKSVNQYPLFAFQHYRILGGTLHKMLLLTPL